MFVGLVDGDDWVDSPMFQALAESAVRFNSDIAQCGYRHCFDSDNTWSDEREYFTLTQKIGDGNGLVANPKDGAVKRTVAARIGRFSPGACVAIKRPRGPPIIMS